MPNQHSFTRSQIRQWARSGALTDERIAAIEQAAQRGNVVDDLTPKPRWTTVPTGPRVTEPAPHEPSQPASRGGAEMIRTMSTVVDKPAISEASIS